MILISTAAANDGLCMPCKRGERRNIEAAKLRRAEQKIAEANPDPATKHWRRLVRRVYPRSPDQQGRDSPKGFANLSAVNQPASIACMMVSDRPNRSQQRRLELSSRHPVFSSIANCAASASGSCTSGGVAS
jgi:hypothetical protein